MFAQPGSGGDKFNPKDHPEWAGKLLLVYPDEYVQGIPNPRPGGDPLDAVKGEIHFIDHMDPATGQPLVLKNTMIFPKVMIGQTKNSIGEMVLGRLGQGQNVNGNPPWVLKEHTEQDAAMAAAYIRSNPRHKAAQPAPVAPAHTPPADDPWSGMNAAPAPAQGGGWGAPAATPAPAPVAAAPGLDPSLEAFLRSKGVDPSGMTPETAALVAKTL